MLSRKPLAITARCRINATYSVVHTEVTIRRITEEIQLLLTDYLGAGHNHYEECPLHEIFKQLNILRDHPQAAGVFGGLVNAAIAVPYEVLKPLIDALPLKLYDDRYDIRYHVLVAGVHAACIDMLAVDEIVQQPILFFPSYNYIWSTDTPELVDDIYFRIAGYVGVSASTSGLARRMYIGLLNAIRTKKEWGEVIVSLIMILASRVSLYDDYPAIDRFFGNLHCHPAARNETLVLEALLNLQHYYDGSNCTVFSDSVYRYCTYFAITKEECEQEGFMLNAI